MFDDDFYVVLFGVFLNGFYIFVIDDFFFDIEIVKF